MTEPQLLVAVIVRNGTETLMVRRGHGPAGGTWTVPTSPLQTGELIAQAVQRTLFEQCGANGVVFAIADLVELVNHELHQVVIVVDGGIEDADALHSPHAATEVAWIDRSALQRLAMDHVAIPVLSQAEGIGAMSRSAPMPPARST